MRLRVARGVMVRAVTQITDRDYDDFVIKTQERFKSADEAWQHVKEEAQKDLAFLLPVRRSLWNRIAALFRAALFRMVLHGR